MSYSSSNSVPLWAKGGIPGDAGRYQGDSEYGRYWRDIGGHWGEKGGPPQDFHTKDRGLDPVGWFWFVGFCEGLVGSGRL